MQKGILVVDDEVFNIYTIGDFLEDEGIHYWSAANGAEALTIMRDPEKLVQAVILDWMMPVMDGMECLDEIIKDPALRTKPVILQTAKTDEKDMIEGYKKGVFQYLKKPYSGAVLISMVKAAIELYEESQAQKLQFTNDLSSVQNYAYSMISTQKKKMELDLTSTKLINGFFSQSLNVENLQSLSELFLDSLKGIEFESSSTLDSADGEQTPENNSLRCSLLLAGSDESSVSVNDRGMISKLDNMILEKSIQTGEIVQNGSYSAVPSPQKRAAILIRNTPTDPKEKAIAIDVIYYMLEQFESRVIHFEQQMELENAHRQVKTIIQASAKELDQVNQNFQDIKMQLMDLLEALDEKALASVAQIDQTLKEKLSTVIAANMNEALELFSVDHITEQKFLLTINQLNNLFSQQDPDEENRLQPKQMSGAEQSDVDALLAAFDM